MGIEKMKQADASWKQIVGLYCGSVGPLRRKTTGNKLEWVQGLVQEDSDCNFTKVAELISYKQRNENLVNNMFLPFEAQQILQIRITNIEGIFFNLNQSSFYIYNGLMI